MLGVHTAEVPRASVGVDLPRRRHGPVARPRTVRSFRHYILRFELRSFCCPETSSPDYRTHCGQEHHCEKAEQEAPAMLYLQSDIAISIHGDDLLGWAMPHANMCKPQVCPKLHAKWCQSKKTGSHAELRSEIRSSPIRAWAIVPGGRSPAAPEAHGPPPPGCPGTT